MIPYDPELIFKVYIPVFRPPGHCIDGLGLYYHFNLNVKKKKVDFFLSRKSPKILYPPLFFEMRPYDPEPILKVYIPVFRPPGHYIDGLALF